MIVLQDGRGVNILA